MIEQKRYISALQYSCGILRHSPLHLHAVFANKSHIYPVSSTNDTVTNDKKQYLSN